MENSENASSQNDERRKSTTTQLQQQQCSSGMQVIEKTEGSVKKLIKPVPLKGLGKISPALSKNVRDAMKNAVAKSKGEIFCGFL